MREEDMGRFAVGMHCSMLHAIRDKLVAGTHGLVPVEDADTDRVGHSKESAEVQHRQGKDENIQAALQVNGGRMAEDEREVECSVVNGGRMAEDEREVECSVAPAAPQVYGDKLVEDEEVAWSAVQLVGHQSLNGWVAHQKGSSVSEKDACDRVVGFKHGSAGDERWWSVLMTVAVTVGIVEEGIQ
ncbi:hypothetical protein BHM03_00021053 [Ensete ventricosum]|nr:hypothetical protein BHM03_00021053 [Ensete ventricosum]